MKYTNPFLTIALLAAIVACSSEERYEPRVQRPEKAHRLTYVKYRTDFNDMNDTHLAAAQVIGIRPLASRDEIENASRELVFLDEMQAYEVEISLTPRPCSFPRLPPCLKRLVRAFKTPL